MRTTLRRRVSASLTAVLASATLVATAIPSAAAAPAARATDDSCPDGKTPEAGFDDTDGTTHDASIDCIVAWDIAKGVTTSEYQPAKAVQRDQMATFIANVLRAGGVTVKTDAPDAFPDDDGSVHEKNINALAELGVIKGDSEGNYNPAAPVQRDQMATFLNGAYAEITGAALESTEDFFADDDGNVHEDNINGVASKGITGGTADGGYSPKQNVNRGAMGSFIARELDLMTEGGFAFPPFLGPALTAEPGNVRMTTDDTYEVVFTVLDANLEPVANQPVDIHVIENGKKACEVTTEADPNSTGSTACTIDALDPLTDSAGQVTFSYEWNGTTLAGERTHRVLAFTDSLNAVYASSNGLKGEAIARWINPVESVLIVDQSPAEAKYGTTTNVTVQAVDENGAAVPLGDVQVIFSVTRGQNQCSTNPVGGSNVHGPDVGKTNDQGKVNFSYVGPADPDPAAANTTTDCLIATWDSNEDGTRQFSEPGEGETRRYSDEGATQAPGKFEVTPEVATVIIQGQNFVFATVRDSNGNLLAGQEVFFRVYRNNASPNSEQSSTVQRGYRTTDSKGVATFAYLGPNTSADDVIVTCLDNEKDGCGGFATIAGAFTPQEPDTTARTEAYWMEVAPASAEETTYDGDIIGFSIQGDRIDTEVGSKNYRFSYDATSGQADKFFIGATEKTLAEFEAALEDGKSLSVNYKPGGVSTFTLSS